MLLPLTNPPECFDPMPSSQQSVTFSTSAGSNEIVEAAKIDGVGRPLIRRRVDVCWSNPHFPASESLHNNDAVSYSLTCPQVGLVLVLQQLLKLIILSLGWWCKVDEEMPRPDVCLPALDLQSRRDCVTRTPESRSIVWV